MKRLHRFLLIPVTLSLLFAQGVAGQEFDISTASLSDLDFSNATVSLAGPESLYIRSVETDQGTFSFLLQPVEPGGLSVTQVIPEDQNLLPPTTIVDFATITPADDGTIRIDGVIIDGAFYSGALGVDESGTVAINSMLTRTDDPQIREARLQAVASLIDAPTEEEFATLLEQEQQRLESIIAEVRAERDALAEENQTLREERDALEEELAALPGAAPADDSDRPTQEELAAVAEARDAARAERDALSEELSDVSGELDTVADQRDALQQNLTNATEQNAKLQDQVAELREQISSLQSENVSLQTDLAVMAAEVDRLQRLVDEYEAAPAAAEWEFPGDYVRTADLRAAAAAVANELAALSEQIRSLEAEVADVAETAATPAPRVESEDAAHSDTDSEPSTTPTATREEAEDAMADAERAERLARLQGEVAELERVNAELRQDRDALEQRILDEILNNSLVALMRGRMDQTVVSGLADAAADTGTWSIRDGLAAQTDPGAFFAKAALPANQHTVPTLYSVELRSLDEGWVGAGLHLFVDEVERRRGFGMGSSLLVWLTRDPERRGVSQTYLQVYRSDDDVNMERVLDAAIPESIGSNLQLEVLYEPGTQYITVAINGEDKVRYRTWFGIESGVEVALRSLGRAEFRDFSIRSATER
jgi:septal ring factor EnvC (AmiA/AmiB activator)